ncbi:MAG: peptide ABC transporter substrate-binding protein [Negativibacillus sp.]|nr:peptide ABC transporter substrate-binding protein [Negativibacillus sp.]
MKKVLALTLAMLLCVSMLAGCGKSEEEQQTEQQTTEQESADNTNGVGLTSGDCKGKVLAWNIGVDSASFDPANSISADSKSVINNTLEGLMRNTGEGAAPAMAQQMPEEKVNEDGTVTLTYTLREATWSDGQPVTAGDFAFAWKRCADPENQMSNAYLMSVLANYDDIAAGLADVEELGVKAVDDTTLEVTLKQPTAYFNELLCLPAFMPLREDMVGTDSSWSKDPQRAVANGPFVFAGYTEGKELILKKNDSYWNKDTVAMDYIVARMLDEQMAPVGMAFGDISMTAGTVEQPKAQTDTSGNTVEVPQLAETIEAASVDSNRIVSLVVNANTGNSYLKDAKVRAALSQALDRTAAAQAAGGDAVAKPALSLSTQAGDILSAQPDTQAAKEAIEAVEAKDEDKSIEIVYLDNEQTQAALETVKSAWESLGFSVTLTAQDPQTFTLSRNSLQYSDLLCSVWDADVQDQQLYLQPYLSSNMQSGCGYSNPEFDQMMLDAIQGEQAQRQSALTDAEKLLLSDAYVMPLYRQMVTITTDTAKVSGWNVSADGTLWFGSAAPAEK